MKSGNWRGKKISLINWSNDKILDSIISKFLDNLILSHPNATLGSVP
jgi:hypothetical protein